MTIDKNWAIKALIFVICLQSLVPYCSAQPESLFIQTRSIIETIKTLAHTQPPCISFRTPRILKQQLLQNFKLACPPVTQWIESYIRKRASNVSKLIVLVGDIVWIPEARSKTTYLLLHQKSCINIVILGQDDYYTLKKYLADPDTADTALLTSVHNIQAQLDRVANQFENYRTFYAILASSAFLVAINYSLLHWLQEFILNLLTLPDKRILETDSNELIGELLLSSPWKQVGLTLLTSISSLILLSRYWENQDDAAISDDIDALEGFKTHLEELKKDTYNNQLVRFFFSDWSTPSPESRLAKIQQRIDTLKLKRSQTTPAYQA